MKLCNYTLTVILASIVQKAQLSFLTDRHARQLFKILQEIL